MIKNLLLIIFIGISIIPVHAQVKDVSVIVAPTAGYNWFDKKSTVENGFMYGLQAGFGFGEVVELRAIYERSADLKQNFGKYEDDIQDVIPGFTFKNRTVSVTRLGGEFKTNIPANGFAPYLLLGTGVQTLKREVSDDENYKNENLYVSGGLGLKINLGDRSTLNLEGRGIGYNMNPNSLLYNENGNSEFDDWINNQKPGRMYNWSVQAALQFYFGGRNEKDLSPLEKSFRDRYSGGLSGTKITLSPAGAYVNFSDNSGYRDTYMYGGILGVDFNNYVGLRGYYYQATKKESLAIDFDDLSMYGLDFMGRLNVARGIVPYITVGGGYLDVQNGYHGKNTGSPTAPVYQETKSGYYAKGGAGVSIPLGRFVDAYGAANLFYTMDNQEAKVGDLMDVDQLNQHTMFNVGLRLKLGKKAQTENVVEDTYDQRFESERYAYRQKIKSLEKELQKAFEDNDSARVVRVVQEKKKLESMQEKKMTETKPVPSPDTLVRMTPAELESLIEKTIKGVEEEESKSNVEKRLDRMEQLLINLNEARDMNNMQLREEMQKRNYELQRDQLPKRTVPDTLMIGSLNNATTQLLVDEINKLKSEVRKQNATITSLQKEQQTKLDRDRSDQRDADKLIIVPDATTPKEYYDDKDRDVIKGSKPPGPVTSEIGVFLGPSFGEATTFNFGVRLHYPIGNTRIYFMPELYAALGNTTGFGLSANAVYPFNINYPRFTPYIGLGAGINSVASNVSFNTNVILGTTYQMGNGNLFADFTVRGAFKNNQLAVGYRFRF